MKEYGKLCTLIYDLDKKFADNEEIEIYTKHIDSKNDKILEPMCGSGRFYIPLLKSGYNITGFDSSNEMLKSCRKRCRIENLTPNIYNSTIMNLTNFDKFDHILIPIGSVSLLIEPEELTKSFQNIYKSLNDNGYFVFSFLNFNNCDTEETLTWTESMRYPLDNMEICCKQKTSYNKDSDIIDMKLLYELIQNNSVIEEEHQHFPMKLLKEENIISYLKEIGFENIELLSGEDSGDYFSIIRCQKG